MVRLSLFLLTSAVFLASLGHALVSAQAKPQGKTVWDGVYTDAQAERATAVFSSTCSRCHTLTRGRQLDRSAATSSGKGSPRSR